VIRATVDTNITVSGLLFGGLPLKIIRMALNTQFTWVTSAPLMEETERVLSSDKFGLKKVEVASLIGPIFDIAEIVVPKEEIRAITRCPADNRVLECAIEGTCSVIVTGDRRDLISLGGFRGIRIVTARQFLEIISDNSQR
jgi:putative PIN family toxin of toxin-antitoxin system